MNKRMKTFIALFMLALTAGQNAYAQKAVKGSKELPLEMNLMIESYQAQAAENYEKILPIIMRIDQYARALNKEDIFLIGKVEVYKTLLKNYDAPIKIPVDGASITTLQTALNKSTDNFTKWFIQALLKDAQDLINNPAYKEFLLQKNSTVKMEKPEYRRLEKKGELLQFWISKITPEAEDFPDTLKKELSPKMLETLKNIQNSFYFMAKEATLGNLPEQLKGESELKFFAVSDVIPMAAPKKDQGGSKTVEDILAPLTDEKPPVLPQPTQENWLEDENAPSSLQNLPKPTNDADWLQDF